MPKINTLNESSLHRTLKTLYSLDENAKTEVELDGKIYDIVKKNQIIEIQTQNLEKMLSKSLSALEKGRKIKVVYPLAVAKYIATFDEDGKKISRRKSPVIRSIYNIFEEITGLYPVLLEKNFTLDVVLCKICEVRTRTETAVQSANGRRRFKKNWLKNDKLLEEIIETRTFKKPHDYLSLLPKTLGKEFTVKDISAALKENKNLPKSASRQASIMVWVLSRMGLIEHVGFRNRAKVYRKLKNER